MRLSHRLAILLFVGATVRLTWVLGRVYLAGDGRRHHLEAAWLLFAAVALAASALLSRTRVEAPNSQHSRPFDARFLLFVIAGMFVYWPCLSIGLLSDDYVLLNQPFVGDWEFFRPFPLLLWRAIYPAFGAAGLHTLNLLLHIGNSWMVVQLVARLSERPFGTVPLIAGSVFLTHPATVEPVAWNAGIFDVSLTTFTLIYVFALTGRSWFAAAVGMFALIAALATKETAVVVPLLAALVVGRPAWNSRVLAASAVAVAVYTVARFAAATAALPVSTPVRYFLKELVVRPFATLVVPWTTSEISSSPVLLALLPQVLIVGFTAGYVFARRPAQGPMSGLAWIVVAVMPLLGFFYIGPYLDGSRYLYLPLVGWCIFVARLADGQASRIARLSAVAVLCSAVVGGTYGVRWHLEPWSSAATQRDVILVNARSILTSTHCSQARFVGLPDRVGGAYLFRNGFEEALRMSGVHLPPAYTAEGPACTFEWSGNGFSLR